MAPKANGRKRSASVAVADTKSSKAAKRAVTPSAAAPMAAAAKVRAGSLAPGTPTRRARQGPVYSVKQGINPLPAPVKPISLAEIKQGLPIGFPATAAASSSSSSSTSSILPRQLFVFGNGDMGQHGLGTDVLDEIKRPRKHPWVADKIANGDLGAGGLEQIVAGGMHTLAIDGVGRVWSWGINDNAALGRNTTREPDIEAEVYETEPMPVEGLSPTGKGTLPGSKEAGGGTQGEVEKFRATRIAAGDSVSVALSEDGQVRVWGSFRSNDGLLGFDGQVGSSKTQFQPVSLPTLLQHSFTQVACGDDHVLALTTTGLVYSWGNGQQAQLGRRIIERRKINGLNPEKVGLRDIVLIGTGAYHSFAVDKKGQVYGWGLNSLRQVGIDTEEDIVPTPRLIPSLSPKSLSADGSVRVVAIEAGQHHSLFLLSDGRVFGCGRCDGCELGLAPEHEAMVEVKAMREEWRQRREEELKVETEAWQKRMDEKRQAQQSNGGTVDAAMANVVSSDDLPPVMGPPPDEFIATPVHIPFPGPDNKIAFLSSGARQVLAVGTNGTLYSWGFGNQSQLGLGDEEAAQTPTEVKSKQFKGHRAVMVGAGGQHSTVLAVRDPEITVD